MISKFLKNGVLSCALLLTSFLLVSDTHAQTITQLLVAKSDYLKKDRILSLKTDKLGNAVSLIHNTGDAVEEFSTSDLKKRIVLYKESKFGISKDVNWISSDSFDPTRGGVIQLTVLREFKSVFSFDYRVLNLELWRDKGEWRITLADLNENTPFDTVYFYSLRDTDGEVLGTDSLAFFHEGVERTRFSTNKMRED